MASPINPTAPAANARPEAEPTAEERFTAKPQSKAASIQPAATPDFMERESARDTAQTSAQTHTGPGPSTASSEAAASADARNNAAGIEDLGALVSKLSNLQSLDDAASIGDVDPKLGQSVRVSDEQLKAIPSKILEHLLNPEGNASAPIDESVIDTIEAIHTSAAAGQAADAEQAFNKPIKGNRDLTDLIEQIATTPAPTDESAPLSNDIIAPMERLIEGDYPMDIMAFVQWVLRESYLETTHSLRDFANRVRFFNEQKEAVRNELDRVRGILSDKPNAEAGDQVGPFESGKFNETYLGSQIEKSKATTKEPASTEETEFKVLALPHLRDINLTPTLSSDAPLVDTKDLIVPSFTSFGDAQEASSTQLMHEHKDTMVERFMQWFDGLNSVEQAAVLNYLRTEGLTVSAHATEVDNGWLFDPDNTFSHHGPAKVLGKNEDLKAFLTGAIGDAITNITASLENDEAEYELGGFILLLNLGHSTKDSRPLHHRGAEEFLGAEKVISYRPSELKEASREIVKIHATNSGEPSTTTTHFSAGDTVKTKAEAEAYVEYLENRLNTIGDDAQLANVDLQNWLQKQQQTLQMMSTISKQLHDTAMAIIRKMGG